MYFDKNLLPGYRAIMHRHEDKFAELFDGARLSQFFGFDGLDITAIASWLLDAGHESDLPLLCEDKYSVAARELIGEILIDQSDLEQDYWNGETTIRPEL